MADAKGDALLLALGAPKGVAGGDSGEKGDDTEASAASDILDAVKADDAEGLRDALKRFVSSCMASYDADEDEAPESER